MSLSPKEVGLVAIALLLTISLPGVVVVYSQAGARTGLPSDRVYQLSTSVPTPHAPSQLPPRILYYVPVNITNGQSTGTQAPFQAMVIVNSLVYHYYESPDLSNVEFFASDGSVIPSWLERGNNNNSTLSVYWLKISGGISGGGIANIYLGFANMTTNLFNLTTTGEAPTLSPTYGAYDDGGAVFQFYNNFNGTALEAPWIMVSNPGATGSVVVNNGVTVGGVSDWYGIALNSSLDPQKVGTIDFYGNFSSISGTDTHEFGWITRSGETLNTLYAINNYGGQYSLVNYNGVGSSEIQIYQPPAVPEVLSLNVTSAETHASANYTHAVSNGGRFIGVPSANLDSMARSGSQFLQWVRIRTSPPNGVMPSATFGRLVVATTTQVSCSPSETPLGGSSECEATVKGYLPSGILNWTSSQGTLSRSGCVVVTYLTPRCFVAFTPSSLSPATITATYQGDPGNFKSSGAFTLGVGLSVSATSVVCTPSSVAGGSTSLCTATVNGYSPSGTVSWMSSVFGSFTPGSTCTLSSGACSVTYTMPFQTPKVTITAKYSGDSQNLKSQGAFPLSQLSPTTTTSSTTTTTTTSSSVQGTSTTTTTYTHSTVRTSTNRGTVTVTFSTSLFPTGSSQVSFFQSQVLIPIAVAVVLVFAFLVLRRRSRAGESIGV